jgi:hypothetical protein
MLHGQQGKLCQIKRFQKRILSKCRFIQVINEFPSEPLHGRHRWKPVSSLCPQAINQQIVLNDPIFE